MHHVTTFLWFNDQAEEAARHYTSVLPGAKITGTMYYTEAGPGKPGSVVTVTLEVAGHELILLNGGDAHYDFSEAISLMLHCDTQDEADRVYDGLTQAGGHEAPCGWLKDKYGVSWQVVPPGVFDALNDPDPARAKRAYEAMFTMTKLDVTAIRAAVEGAAS